MNATSLLDRRAPAAEASPTSAAVTGRRSLARMRPELALLLLIAGVLNFWGLSENGWANEYYSAAVRSMSSSWHAFLYGSFDASGAMTVDKPPLASWVQVAFVKVFGFHSLSLLVPQALMGVASVALVYDLTRRLWGRPAGFVAGLALATTPIAVAISRHNNPDALLILCCVGALWATVRALEDGRTRWIVLAGVCVGLGFEAKMPRRCWSCRGSWPRGCGSPRAGGSSRCASCWRAGPRWSRSAAPGRCCSRSRPPPTARGCRARATTRSSP
jgi:hypothetical protein